MTTAELNREALLDIDTMRRVGQLAFWHDDMLRASMRASGYGYWN